MKKNRFNDPRSHKSFIIFRRIKGAKPNGEEVLYASAHTDISSGSRIFAEYANKDTADRTRAIYENT